MAKWVFDQWDNVMEYPTLGIIAEPGDILDAVFAPDARWSLNADQGAAETVYRYAIGGDPDYIEPTDGHVLTYDATQNTYVPTAPELVGLPSLDAAMADKGDNPASAFRGWLDPYLAATYGAGRLGAETRAPAGYPKSFIANGEGNTIAPIPLRGKDPVRSHLEGYGVAIYDQSGHAEGTGTVVDGKISHAEGNNSIATANDSHAEGNLTIAGRRYYTDPDTLNLTTGSEDAGSGLGVLQYVVIPTAEGDVTSWFPNPLTDNITTRYGAGAQIDSQGNVYQPGHTPAVWDGSTLVTANDLQWALHPVAVLRGSSEGEKAFVTIKKAVYSGGVTKVYYAGAKPFTTIIGAASSYAPNLLTGGTGNHAEGFFTSTAGRGAHSEGMYSRAWHTAAHAEGARTRATGTYSHAEGEKSKASGSAAHSEGNGTTASGDYSHAEGYLTTASGHYSHSEGESTTASGTHAHAEGRETTAAGAMSRASGSYAVATRDGQDAYAFGRRSVNGDSQTSRIAYSRTVVDAGWHAINAVRSLVDGRTYHFDTLVVGRQTAAASAGAVGNSFAYRFSGLITVTGTAITVHGTITRTLVGRTAGMTGDGLTTGPRLTAYTTSYLSNGTTDLIVRYDGEAGTTFHIHSHTTFQEIA